MTLKHKLSISILFAFISASANAQEGPPGYLYLGKPEQTFNLKKRSNIAFGLNGKYRFLYGVTGKVKIDKYFGDPYPGMPKKVFYRELKNSQDRDKAQGPDGYYSLAEEGEQISLRFTSKVAYGYNGQYSYRAFTPKTIKLTNAVFGDPAPGWHKYAFFKPADMKDLGPEGFTYLGEYGSTHTLKERSIVAFGLEGRFSYLYGVKGRVTIDSKFGDPYPGIKKYAYYKAIGSADTGYLDGVLKPYGIEKNAPKGYRFAGEYRPEIFLKEKSNVAFGLKNRFAYLYGVQGKVQFKNRFADPYPNQRKYLWVKAIKNANDYDPIQGPDGYYKLTDRQMQNLPMSYNKGIFDYNAAWGNRGNFAFKQGIQGKNQIPASSSFFKKDPLPGKKKYVFIYRRGVDEQGPDGYKFLGADGEEVVLEKTSHIAYGALGNFFYFYNASGRFLISGMGFFGEPASNMVKYGYYKEADTQKVPQELVNAIKDIKAAVFKNKTFTHKEYNHLTAVIKKNLEYLANSEQLIQDSIAIVKEYENTTGPFFVSKRTPPRFKKVSKTKDGLELDRAVFVIQQGIHSVIVNSELLNKRPEIFRGLAFKTAEYFPGWVDPPADPKQTYTVKIKATNKKAWGIPTAYVKLPAKRMTGAYLAPGSVATVEVPQSIVNKGFNILVGSHVYEKVQNERFDQVIKIFSIDRRKVLIANPFGGSIYIMVPEGSQAGNVNIKFTNVVRSPYFARTSLRKTSLEQWRNIERNRKAPWADFETDLFMITVPTTFIYKFDNPLKQLENWDAALRAVNTLHGKPSDYDKPKLYIGVDVNIIHALIGAFGIGYPQTNHTYDPFKDYGGNYIDIFTSVKGGHDVTFHEMGHAQGFSYFPGHGEAIVQILYIYINNAVFGTDIDTALAKSIGNASLTRDESAKAWMIKPNFRAGKPMDRSHNTTGEVAYQHKGFARYAEIADLFGWQCISDFYRDEQLYYMKHKKRYNSHDIDSRIFRLSKFCKTDLRPLIHFWGVHPVEPEKLKSKIDKAGLKVSAKFYDRLIHYKSIIPANNHEFNVHYKLRYPMQEDGHPDYGAGWYKSWKDRYNESHARKARAAMQNIINLYYPEGRP